MPRNNKKNSYVEHARISEAKFRGIVRCFCVDLEANKAAVIARVNRNTVNRYYKLFRQRIAAHCEAVSGKVAAYSEMAKFIYHPGEICTADADHLVAIITEGDALHAMLLTAEATSAVRALLQGPNGEACALASTCSRILDGVLDLKNQCPARIPHVSEHQGGLVSKPGRLDLFARYIRTRIRKFNGIAQSTLYLHVKECEYRFNHRDKELYPALLKMFRENPLS